jgi:hypothetical protein
VGTHGRYQTDRRGFDIPGRWFVFADTRKEPTFDHSDAQELGDPVGIQIEEEFTRKAKQAGFTEEEAKNAFNSNMMATGLLSEKPAEFAREHNRCWLVAEYQAGDVVLHKPHAV